MARCFHPTISCINSHPVDETGVCCEIHQKVSMFVVLDMYVTVNVNVYDVLSRFSTDILRTK